VSKVRGIQSSAVVGVCAPVLACNSKQLLVVQMQRILQVEETDALRGTLLMLLLSLCPPPSQQQSLLACALMLPHHHAITSH
jgi:hypothetical protein